jgi:hypothetical protein
VTVVSKMTVRRIPSIVFAAALAVFACGGQTVPPKSSETPTTQQTIYPFELPSSEDLAFAKDKLATLPHADRRFHGTNWQNPVVTVLRFGIIVKPHVTDTGSAVPLRDVPVLLAKLPADAWPYGRLVMLTEPAISSSETEPSDADIETTRAVLESMGLETTTPIL